MDFVVLTGANRAPRPGLESVRRADPDERCEITLKLRRRQQLPEPIGGQIVIDTPLALSGEFGASDDDIALVCTALRDHDIECRSVNQVARSISASGRVAKMQEFFQTELSRGVDNGRQTRFRSGDLCIPAALQKIVVGVFGLDDRAMVQQQRPLAMSNGAPTEAATVDGTGPFLPSELADAYEFAPQGRSSATVGIIALGGAFVIKDFDGFCNLANITTPPHVLVQTAQTPTDENAGDPMALREMMLDVEIVAGVCPTSKIVVYLSNSDERGWIDALDAVVSDSATPPDIVSISWGFPEGAPFWTTQATAAINDTLQELACRGVVVCVAAGDNGSSAGIDDGRAHVAFPASSPYVLSVGGTLLTKTNDGIDESAWNQHQHRTTGGGVSSVFARPVWQQSIDIPSANASDGPGRIVPDVSACAGAFSYRYFQNGIESRNGCTSASAQLWAGLLARIRSTGKPLSFITPLFYEENTQDSRRGGEVGCRDVQRGDNRSAGLGYDARPGYDAVTGWGSPNGVALPRVLGTDSGTVRQCSE